MKHLNWANREAIKIMKYQMFKIKYSRFLNDSFTEIHVPCSSIIGIWTTLFSTS